MQNIGNVHIHLDGLDLTDDEKRFLEWLSDWDFLTKDSFNSILRKIMSREFDNGRQFAKDVFQI